MSSAVLAGLYVAIGFGCALPELITISKLSTSGRRIARLMSALATVILWPLWAPFALAPRRPVKRRSDRPD